MIQELLILPSRLFLGKGTGKRFPRLLSLYKKIFSLLAKNELIEVDIPLGLKLLVSSKDCGVGMFLRLNGELDPLHSQLFLDSLKPNFTVFDIGANVGYYTVLASKIIGKGGRIYAIEPNPDNLDLLKKNIKLNNCRNVIIVNRALGERSGLAEMALDEASPGESSLAQNAKGKKITVQITTLDNFTKLENIKQVDVIKIDIEGGEIQALKGGAEFLKRSKEIRLFIECNVKTLKLFNSNPKKLVNLLEEFGYKIEKITNEIEKTVSRFSNINLEQALSRVNAVGLVAQK